MTDSNASPLQPLSVGTTDSGDFSSWLGKPVQVGAETYVMCQSSVAIASGSNGLQLITHVSGSSGNFIVILATGAAGTAEILNCGAIPSSLTGPIASGAYFLALRDSPGHVLTILPAVTGGTGGVASGTLLYANGSGSTLTPVITGAAGTTGTTTQIDNLMKGGGSMSLAASTSVVAISGLVMYHAPFRGAA